MAIKKIKLPDNTTEDINDPRLPAVSTTDNGKVLSVSGGIWAANSKPSYTLDEVADGSTRKLANYLPLTGGTITGTAATPFKVQSNIATLSLVGFLNSNGTTLGGLGVDSTKGAVYYDTGTKKIWHEGNSNKSDVDWACKKLTTGGGAVIGGNTFSYGTVFDINRDGGSGVIQTTSKLGFEAETTSSEVRVKVYTVNGSTSSIVGFAGLTLGGNFGLGSYSASEKLYVSGNILATGAITPGSDSRIKDDQKELSSENALFVIENLKPKTWVWNKKSNENLNGKSGAGLVAQEVKEILPEAVTISENGDIKDFHSLNYNTIQGYEIAAIKGLIEEVKSLKAEIAELKKQIK